MKPSWQRRAIFGIFFLVAGVLLTGLYANAARHFPLNSDNANTLLWAREFNRGNWLMSHWYMGTISYYTEDLLFFSLALRVLPYKPSTLYNVYPLIYTLVLGMCVWLGGRRGPKRWDTLGALAVLGLLAFPAPMHAPNVLLGPLHTATFIWVLPALIALDFMPTQGGYELASGNTAGRLPWLRLGLAAFFLFMALFGDQFVTYHTILPLILVALLRLRRGATDRRMEFAIIGVCLIAWGLVKVVQAAFVLMHGFTIPDFASNLNIAFVETGHLCDNIGYTLHGLVLVFGADFFGHRIGHQSVLPILCALGLAFVSYILCRALGTIIRSQRETAPASDENKAEPAPPLLPDRIVATIGLGILINVASYALTNVVDGLTNLRYFVPVILYSGILLGRYGVPLWRATKDSLLRRDVGLLFGAACLGWMMTFAYSFVRQPRIPEQKESRLAHWLMERNLTCGYGTYWGANILDLESRGAVQAGAIIVKNDKVVPYLWITDERWYHEKPAHFLVINHPAWGFMSEEKVKDWFGPPDETHDFDDLTVYVWKKDITPLVVRE